MRCAIWVLALTLLLNGQLDEADAAGTIKIASIYSLSGPAAKDNRLSMRGVRLAVREINASGGVLGMPFELLEIDNGSTPIGSKIAAEQAFRANVTAVIGAAYSSHSLAIAQVAQDNGVPMISSISTSPELTKVGNYIFRVCFDDRLQGRVMGEFARYDLKAKGVVVLFNMSSDYSLGLANSFEKAFIQTGGSILAKLPYKARQPNFRELVAKAKATAPDAIFIAGHDESASIVKEAIRVGLEAVPLGGDGWDIPSFYIKAENDIKIGYFSTHWSAAIESDPSKAFVVRYGGEKMNLADTALAYDAVQLLADAIRRAGSTRRLAVRDALASTKKYPGVTGTLSFDPYGDPIKSVVIMKISNGRAYFLKRVHPKKSH